MTTWTPETKNIIVVTWANILTTWATETRTWEGLSFWVNESKTT
jgi:hypothetical protein